MFKILCSALNAAQKKFVNNLIRASYMEIVRPEECQRLIREGLIKDVFEVKKIHDLGKKILSHRCSPRCQVMVGPNKFVCRKPNNLSLNPPPSKTREKFIELPNDYSIDSLRRLEQVGIIEPLVYDENFDILQKFKSRLPFFHPKRHIPPVNFTNDLNISPVKGYTFSYC